MGFLMRDILLVSWYDESAGCGWSLKHPAACNHPAPSSSLRSISLNCVVFIAEHAAQHGCLVPKVLLLDACLALPGPSDLPGNACETLAALVAIKLLKDISDDRHVQGCVSNEPHRHSKPLQYSPYPVPCLGRWQMLDEHGIDRKCDLHAEAIMQVGSAAAESLQRSYHGLD